MTRPQLTGLQYVVLSAYLRVLPERSDLALRIGQALGGEPLPASRARVAVTLAEQSGLLEHGRITEFGRKAARAYARQLDPVSL